MSNVVENIISKFSGKSIMEGIDKNPLKEFTQKYYGLIVLSGRKENYKNIRIDAFPYINDKETRESLSKKYKEYATTEDILIYFRASENQELYISERGIYFNMFDVIDEEPNSGFVPFENISSLEVVQKGDYFCLECNGVLLITDDVKNKDFYEDIDLKEYIKHLMDKNLTISEDDMADAVKRHMNIRLYETIKQKLCNYKILSVVFGSGVRMGFSTCIIDTLLIFVPNHFVVYVIGTGRWCSLNKYKSNSFEVKMGNYRYVYGDRYDDYYSYNSRQMNPIIQYMNEIVAEKEKEKAIEADIQKQVEKLVKLKTIGLITDEEFDEKRKALLERMGI